MSEERQAMNDGPDSPKPVLAVHPGSNATARRARRHALAVPGVRFAVGVTLWLVLLTGAQAQPRPYIGFVYPAGGQQGTTIQIRLGGQGLEGVNQVLVTGPGVTARLVDYYWRLSNQEVQLLNEQIRVLRRSAMTLRSTNHPSMMSDSPAMMVPSSSVERWSQVKVDSW